MKISKYINSHSKNKKFSLRVLAIAVVMPSLSFLMALGLILVRTPLVDAACGAATYGTDTMSVTVPTSTTYNVWVRMQVPSTSENSIMLQVDGGTCFNVGGSSSITPSTWTWVDYQNGSTSQTMQLPSLAAGTHSLELLGTDPGVEIDSVLLLNDVNCVPTGLGTNCTTNQPIPTAPTLSATATGQTSVALSWTGSTDSQGPGLAGYYLLRNGTQIQSLSSSTTSYTDNTVKANTTYTYTVEAYDSGNPPSVSPASNAVQVTTPANNPTPPTVNLTNPTSGQTVSGTVPVSATASDAVGVTQVQFLINGTVVATDKTGPSPYTYSWNTTTYANTYGENYYTVEAIAYDAAGLSTASEATSINVANPTPKPSTPTGLSVTSNNYDSVSLGWTASNDNGGPGLKGYYVLRSTNGGTPVTLGSSATPSYTDNMVSANTTYTYSVEAYDIYNNLSNVSTSINDTTPNIPDTTPPTQPTNLTAPAASDSEIVLSWTASYSQVGVKDYGIYRSTSGATATEVGTSTTTSYGDTNLPANTSYTYYVIAYDVEGLPSVNSATASGTTFPASTNTTSVVDGTVTSSQTAKPITGASIYTGGHGTANGAARSTTNGYGQYALIKIIPNLQHHYVFGASGYKQAIYYMTVPLGSTLFNASLTPN